MRRQYPAPVASHGGDSEADVVRVADYKHSLSEEIALGCQFVATESGQEQGSCPLRLPALTAL